MVVNVSLISHKWIVLQGSLHCLDALLVLLVGEICQSKFIQNLSVFVVYVKSSVKVFNRILEHPHVIVTLSSILEELNVLWLQTDGLIEMVNSFFELAHHVVTLS